MRYAKPGAVLARARAIIAETQATVAEARVTAIQAREHIQHIQHLQDLIEDTRHAIEVSRETLQRCPTL